jgi:hypothetical protein
MNQKLFKIAYRVAQSPVVHVIKFVTFSDEEFLEHLSKISIIRLIFKSEGSAIVEVSGILD